MKSYLLSQHDSSLDISRDVFIHPTNSCYGIGANIFNEHGYHRIYELKGREKNKPFFITVSDIETLKKYAVYDDRIDEYFTLYPDITFTFILQRSPLLPDYINPNLQTIGIQIASGILTEICNASGGVMFGTSANLAGENPIYTPKEIESVFGSFSDILFLSGGVLEKTSPSTIIDLSSDTAQILRGTLN